MKVLESQIGDYQKRLSARTREKDRAHSWFNLGLVLTILLGSTLVFGYFANWSSGWILLLAFMVFCVGGLVISWRRVRSLSRQGLVVPEETPARVSLVAEGFQLSTEVEVIEVPWSEVRRARYVFTDSDHADEVHPYVGCIIIDVSGVELTMPEGTLDFDGFLEAASERTEVVRQLVLG